MGDDKTVEAVVIFLNAGFDLQPVLRTHIRRIQIEELAALHAADIGKPRRACEDFLSAQKRSQSLLRGL